LTCLATPVISALIARCVHADLGPSQWNLPVRFPGFLLELVQVCSKFPADRNPRLRRGIRSRSCWKTGRCGLLAPKPVQVQLDRMRWNSMGSSAAACRRSARPASSCCPARCPAPLLVANVVNRTLESAFFNAFQEVGEFLFSCQGSECRGLGKKCRFAGAFWGHQHRLQQAQIMASGGLQFFLQPSPNVVAVR
jgi:hypothetical protein